MSITLIYLVLPFKKFKLYYFKIEIIYEYTVSEEYNESFNWHFRRLKVNIKLKLVKKMIENICFKEYENNVS